MPCKCDSWLSIRTQKLFERFFKWFGTNTYHYPKIFIGIGLFITLLCAVGNIWITQENRSLYLWIPRDSEIFKEFEKIQDYFGTFTFLCSLIITTKDESNILTPNHLNDIYDIFFKVNDINAMYDGQEYTYAKLCEKLNPNDNICESEVYNIFNLFFGYDSSLWNNSNVILNTINGNTELPKNVYFGGLKTDENGGVISSNALWKSYYLQGTKDPELKEIINEYMLAFTNYWMEHANDYPNLKVYYYSDRAFDDETFRVLLQDLPLFAAAICIMLIYLMLTLGNMSCVGARPLLACSAIIVLICALVVAFGIGSILGKEFTTIVMLVPYILLGVGVDDMIILMDAYDRTPLPDNNILNEHLQLGNALKEAGLSITLTSFCSCLAFAIGSFVDIPGVNTFCVYASLAFIANYLLQLLIFVPFMVLDHRRQERSGNFCCPCIIRHNSNNNIGNETPVSEITLQTDGKKRCGFATILGDTLVPILKMRVIRYIVIVIFFIICGLSGYTATLVNTDTDTDLLLPDTSFFSDFVNINRIAFGESSITTLSIVIENEDFQSDETRDKIYDLINDIESDPRISGSVSNWVYEYQTFLNETMNTTIDSLNNQLFYDNLNLFLNDSNYFEWKKRIVFDDLDPNKILYTYFEVFVYREEDYKKAWDQRNFYKNKLTNNNVNGFVYEFIYPYAYISTQMIRLTISNMGFASLGILVILLFMVNLREITLIILTIIMIDIDLFGWLYINNISLDTLVYVQLVMAVGLTVDYVIHIMHAFNHSYLTISNNFNYGNIVAKSIEAMGASVIKGAFTTFLGVIPLAFSNSAAFRIFFKLYSGIILIAILHGMVFVPCVLGELKCIYKGGKMKEIKSVTRMVSHLELGGDIQIDRDARSTVNY